MNRAAFSPTNIEGLFPLLDVLCSQPQSHFSGAAELPAQGLGAGGAFLEPFSISLVTANEPENSLKRWDLADRGLISFVCTCVTHKKLSFLPWGSFSSFFYY
jgi:hypothetical protein